MLQDINSDFGINGQPFEVYADDAIMNFLKNLFRTEEGFDRYEYADVGIPLEATLHEPPTSMGARKILMLAMEALRRHLPNVTLDLQNSTVIPNLTEGSYEVTFVLNGSTYVFSI